MPTHQRNVQPRETPRHHLLAHGRAQPRQLRRIRGGLQRRRPIRPGRRSGQPEDRQHRGDHEVGQRQLRLRAIQIVQVRVHRNDEAAVQHRQHPGGHVELRVAGHVQRQRHVADVRHAARDRIEAERIVEVVDAQRRLLAGARQADVHREVGGGGERADGEDLQKGCVWDVLSEKVWARDTTTGFGMPLTNCSIRIMPRGSWNTVSDKLSAMMPGMRSVFWGGGAGPHGVCKGYGNLGRGQS